MLSQDVFFKRLLLDSNSNNGALPTYIMMPDFTYEAVTRMLTAYYTGLAGEGEGGGRGRWRGRGGMEGGWG